MNFSRRYVGSTAGCFHWVFVFGHLRVALLFVEKDRELEFKSRLLGANRRRFRLGTYSGLPEKIWDF